MTNTNTNTETKTKINTKCIEDPTYAIFSKSRQFKDINYDQTRPGQTRADQNRPGQRREEPNLADLILELAFLLKHKTNIMLQLLHSKRKEKLSDPDLLC